MTPNQILRNLAYGEEARKESPLLNPYKPQGQTSPVNPGIFPAGTADPFKQPPQNPEPPKEPVRDPDDGNPIDYCEARWESRDNGKTKTLVPGSCNKSYHGPTCTHASVH